MDDAEFLSAFLPDWAHGTDGRAARLQECFPGDADLQT
jgi:hypothetical protein